MKQSILDRTISYFSPVAGMKRMHAKYALDRIRGLEAAKHGRRTKNWKASQGDINDILKGGLPTLRARSRDLVMNNPWAKKGIAIVAANTIGRGIIPQAVDRRNTKLADRADGLWVSWGDTTECDADGHLDFYGLQALVMKTVAESGSCLVRRRRRRMSDGLTVPMQVQLLEPDFLDQSKDAVLRNGNRIIQGIEFNRLGMRVAYWLHSDHPNGRLAGLSSFESDRVPADDILHIFRLDRIGQVDGIPWTAPIILRLRDLDEFEDAHLIRQKIAACFTAFVTKPDALDNLENDQQKRDVLERVEPGIIEYLGPGEDVTFASPPQMTGYGEHTKTVLQSIAAGLGISYEALTGDFSQVNFSSSRMGHMQMYANLDQWRDNMIIPKLCKGVWKWFTEAAVMAGELSAPVPATWTAPKREMIDPLKETKAFKEQVRCGFISHQEAVRQYGNDPVEVYAEIEATNKIMDKKGITVDTDARQKDPSPETT